MHPRRSRHPHPLAGLSSVVLRRLRLFLASTTLALLASGAAAEDVWAPTEPMPDLGGWD